MNPSGAKFTCACIDEYDPTNFSAADENKNIFVWNDLNKNPVVKFGGVSSAITTLFMYSEERELYSGLQGGLVVVWDLMEGKIKTNLQGHSTPITAMTFAKVKQIPTFMATGALDGKIKFWDIRLKQQILSLKGHLDAVKTLSISPDCSLIASGSEDGLCSIWDIRTCKKIKDLSISDQGAVNAVEFNPYSITLCYSSNDKTIRHWDIETYNLISETPIVNLPTVKLKFDSTGKNILAASNESLRYWFVDGMPELKQLVETGWNKLQDIKYFEDEAIYGIATYTNKLSYWKINWGPNGCLDDFKINSNRNVTSFADKKIKKMKTSD